jgi:dGTPase
VSLGPPLAGENQRLKQFLFTRLYSHRNVNTERRKLTGSIRRLFEYYVARPRRLPAFYFAQSQKEPVHRIVCDYIAGMTDNYLLEQHRKLLERMR